MEIKVCRYCGNEVSPETGRCVRCGKHQAPIRTRRHRVIGGISAVAIVLFLGGTLWVAFKPSGKANPRDLPPCDDDQVVAAVKRDSPFVTWAQQSGTQPITMLRDIRAGAWDSDKALQHCSATAITEAGSYVISYALTPKKSSPGMAWEVRIFPGS